MKLSIIIPVLNEAHRLPAVFGALLPLVRQGHELILVDGGSSDGTCALALCLGAQEFGSEQSALNREHGFTLLHSARGRAPQMNAGAQIAKNELLVFLHADTDLPANAEHLMLQALRSQKKTWGRFNVRIAGRSRMFPLIASMINLRSQLTGIATGDQAIFVIKKTFEEVGGFPELDLMEDIALCTRLKTKSRPICLHTCVTTSGRRWESHGVWRTIFLMWRLRWLYWRGVSPKELRRFYS